jgi:tetratricopeptide (TPR) repeat protein
MKRSRSSHAGSERAQTGTSYQAFISYNHRDSEWAKWLHRSMERYRPPGSLRKDQGPDVPSIRDLRPVFRDRDELPASAHLTENVRKALDVSRCLVVICSPAAATSPWVNDEIRYFRKLGRDQIYCLIVAGEPGAADPAEECFAPALTERLPEDSGDPPDPVAGDARPGKDGKRNAFLKVAAGMLGVGFDQLKQRERIRRRWQRVSAATVVLALLSLFGWLADYGVRHAKLSQAQRRLAAGLESGDWGPEHLQVIGDAVASVGRLDAEQGEAASRRACRSLVEELDKRIFRPNLTDSDVEGIHAGIEWLAARQPDAAEGARRKLRDRLGLWEPVLEIEEGEWDSPDGRRFSREPERAARGGILVGDDTLQVRAQASGQVKVEADWEVPAGPFKVRVGMLEHRREGYHFHIGREDPAEDSPDVETRNPGHGIFLAIGRGGRELSHWSVPFGKDLRTGILRTEYTVSSGKLGFMINSSFRGEVEDIFTFPPGRKGTFSLQGSEGVRLASLRISRKALPAVISPLEEADLLYAQGDYEHARLKYDDAILNSSDEVVRDEATYKCALCLEALRRNDESIGMFEELASRASGNRWSMQAAWRNWRRLALAGEYGEAAAVLEILVLSNEGTSPLLPPRTCSEVILEAVALVKSMDELGTRLELDEARRMAETMSSQSDMLGMGPQDQSDLQLLLCVINCRMKEADRAREHADRALAIMRDNRFGSFQGSLCGMVCKALAEQGKHEAALDFVKRWSRHAPDERGRLEWKIHLARVLAAGGRSAEAADLVEEMLSDEQLISDLEKQRHHILIPLYYLDGFLRHAKGHPEEAVAAWTRHYHAMHPDLGRQSRRSLFAESLEAAGLYLAIGVRSGALTAEEAPKLLNMILNSPTVGSQETRSAMEVFLKGCQPEVILNLGRNPRACRLFDHVALNRISVTAIRREASRALFQEFLLHQALGEGRPGEELEALSWELSGAILDAYSEARIARKDVVLLVSNFKGAPVSFAWPPLAQRLKGNLRGRVAFMLHLHKETNGIAAESEFFRKDASRHAAKDEALRWLLQHPDAVTRPAGPPGPSAGDSAE